VVEEGDNGLGALFAPHIEEGEPSPADDYPDPREDEQQGDDHAHDYGVDDLDISATAWGKAIE
jgi:hypothetical protein